jgi:uncharacterized protein (DUF302 family)
MPPLSTSGMIHRSSTHSVAETLERLEGLLRSKGLLIFARIDHSGEAAKVGLKMQPTELLIFGSPKGGTPLMIASPTLAIDLPLKALVWQDAEGKVWLSANTAEYLEQRHNVPHDLLQNLAAANALFDEAVR